MKPVYVIGYGHIDTTFLTHPASQADDATVRDMLPCTSHQAQASFNKAGWEGDGTINIIWLPPFLFKGGETHGACVWHVKQANNGTSWLCADRPYEFPGLTELAGNEWMKINLDGAGT